MSTYRKKGKYYTARTYYTGTDNYAGTVDQEYSDDYREQNAEYMEEYQGNQQSGYVPQVGYDAQALQRYRERRMLEERRRESQRRKNAEDESRRQSYRKRSADGQIRKQPNQNEDTGEKNRRQPNRRRNITEEERRQARRRRRMREERRRRRRRRLLIALTARLVCTLVVVGIVISLVRFTSKFVNPVKRKVTVEAGTKLDVKDFLKRGKVKGSFVTDLSKVSLNHVGEQEIVLKVKGKERKSRLIVKDTKPPKAEAGSTVIDVNGKVNAKELVKNIKDATDVRCSFKKKPDLSKEGKVTANIIVTDEGGNTKEVISDIKVIVDTEPPVIDGVAPLTGFIGEPISYKSALTVTDNCVKDMDIEVDNSKVDTKKEGTYDVIYTAVDRAGNKTEASTTITIKEKPENYITPEEVLEEADAVLKEITTEDMTLKEKAKAIYDWNRSEIGYVSTSEKDSWTNGAHQGFTEKSGDCFIFYSTAKALLTQAGIPNLDVVKSDTSHSRHYWSLIDCGDGWYHFDTTPRQGGGDDFFMKTDDEILEYSRNNRDSHVFDQSLYPATPKTDSAIE